MYKDITTSIWCKVCCSNSGIKVSSTLKIACAINVAKTICCDSLPNISAHSAHLFYPNKNSWVIKFLNKYIWTSSWSKVHCSRSWKKVGSSTKISHEIDVPAAIYANWTSIVKSRSSHTLCPNEISIGIEFLYKYIITSIWGQESRPRARFKVSTSGKISSSVNITNKICCNGQTHISSCASKSLSPNKISWRI